ncbi:hypothetical protein BHM03_00007320 [Ensete ventricosum]|nr:hypothetical protein BHM03_00007320 [Ensete ventricosum]
MRTSWADAVAKADSSGRAAYVLPHLRNRPSSSESPAPSPAAGPSGAGHPPAYAAPSPCWWKPLGRWPSVVLVPPEAEGGGGRRHSRIGGWDRREREANPFANDDETSNILNFDAYEDIPSLSRPAIHEEATKFAYRTGVRVVVAYGGAPINQQVLVSSFVLKICL